MSRLMLVDDEENIVRALRRVLVAHGYEVEYFTEPVAALARADATPFDMVISDYRMPQLDGVQFLTAFAGKQPDASRLILSAYTDLTTLLGAINEAHIYRFVSKPWNEAELLAVIAQALEHRALLLENQRLADKVREQQGVISHQEMELKRMQRDHPALMNVKRDASGAVILDEDDG